MLDCTLNTPDKYVCGLAEELSRERSILRELKEEILQLKSQLLTMKDLRMEESKAVNNKDELIENLENQLELLREELRTENEIRCRTEQQLDKTQKKLRRFRQQCQMPTKVERARKDSDLLGRYSTYQSHPIEEETDGTSARASDVDMKELKVQLSETQILFDNACADIHQLENKLADMETKYATSCQMVNKALEKVAEALQLSKFAADERDVALEAKECAERKLESLQHVIENLVDEAGKRTQAEVEKVREQANTNIALLLDELYSVEKERSRLSLQINCDKENSETRPDTDEFFPPGQRAEQSMALALQRARQAETERDDLRLKLELCQMSQERILSEKRNESQRLLDEQKLLETRLRNMEAQRSTMEERIRHHLEAANAAERRLTECRHKSEEAQRTALQQVLMAHQAAELHDSEYRKRIEIIERVAQQSAQRWRELLGAQQKVALKWKTEAYNLADQLEKQGRMFQAEIARSHEETTRLSKRLQKVDRKRASKVGRSAENLMNTGVIGARIS